MDRTPDLLFERFRRTGDPAALAELFDRCAPELLRVALHLSGDPAAAEDLLQSTFVAAIESAPRWDPDRRVVPWLLGILGNHARKARAKRRPEPLGDSEPADPSAAPPAEAEDAEVADRVTRAIDDLPEPYRKAMLLHVKHGLAAIEIAHLLDVPPPTVRSWIRRGGEKLRRTLPRGLVAGALGLLASERGIAAVRDSVLAHVPAPAAAGAAALTGGVLAMKKTLTAALIVAVLAAGGGLLVLNGPAGNAPPAPDAAPERTESPAPGEEPPSSDGLAAKVDLERIDRERDLHGVVVDPDGEPVQGALVRAVHRPWERIESGPRPPPGTAERIGPRGRTDPDGRFALRLVPGDLVHLHVDAEGFPVVVRRRCQAGERTRIVLPRPVTLRVDVRDAEDAPVADATVRLSSRAIASDLLAWERAGTTGRSGACSFEGLPGGDSPRLFVAHPDHVRASPSPPRIDLPAAGRHQVVVRLRAGRVVEGQVVDHADGRPVSGARVSGGPASGETVAGGNGRFRLTVHPRSRSIAVDAEGYAREFVPLPEAGKVEVRLRRGDTVAGRVLDAAGAPVADARVLVTGFGKFGVRDPRAGVTGADGRFEIPNLNRYVDPALHPHVLVVSADGHGRAVHDFHPAPEAGGRIEAGQIILPPPATIRGRVLDGKGTPLSRARVTIEGTNRDRPRLLPAEFRGRPSVEIRELRLTDDLGRFRFPDLAPGDYVVRVRDARVPPKKVALEPGVPERVVELVAGKIGSPLRVRVVDGAGGPVPGVEVRISSRSGILEATTGPRGVADFPDTPRPTGVHLRPPAGPDAPILAVPLATRVERDDAEVTIAVERLAAISGVVVDADGRPVPDVKLEARRDGRRRGGGLSGEDGRFRIGVRGNDPVDLVASGGVHDGRVESVRPGAAGVRLIVREVVRGRRLSVIVLAADGAPVEGVVLRIGGAPDRPTAVTNEDGRAAFDDLPEREVTVTPKAPRDPGSPVHRLLETSLLPAPVKVVPAGQLVQMRLRPGRILQGTMRLPRGRKARILMVDVAEAGRFLRSVRAAADGSFEILVPATPAGDLELRAGGVGDDGGRLRKDLVLEPDARDVEIVFD